MHKCGRRQPLQYQPFGGGVSSKRQPDGTLPGTTLCAPIAADETVPGWTVVVNDRSVTTLLILIGKLDFQRINSNRCRR